MTKIIAKRKELLALSHATNGFDDIANCGVIADIDDSKEPKYLEKYEEMMRAAWPDEMLQKYFKEYGYTGYQEIHGFVFGEPFFNFWLIEHGKSEGIEWSRIATQTEDYKGLDAFGTRYDSTEEEELGFQHKMYPDKSTIKQSHVAGLGWAPIAYRPILVTTANHVSLHIKDRIEERNGACILRQNILDGTENPHFWNNYAELLHDNIIELDRIIAKAEKEARTASNRKLDDWQAEDLNTLLALDCGIVIAPPGSGKTTIEAKLAESWMMEEGE